MGQTRYYSLSFFDFGDQLDSAINVQKEIDRFVVVDEQLYGLYKVFGNGVIEGWTVQDEGYQGDQGISISISQGIGVINYMAAETPLPGYIYDLPPNSLIDIYATLTGSTSLDRVINFIYSISPVTNSNAIRIARLATGSNSISYIDNNVRDLIGFEEIIQTAINEHKHRGTPSKIDLENEVRNQLSGARLEGIDASKITSGQFNIDRIPLIDHNDLENNGLLTHAAIDSFVQTLSQNNKELLGEISSVNLLKLILFWKYNYSNVDEHFINELALIPGVSPNNFIDFNASTAHINLTEHCISGIPARSGIFTSVYWNSTFSFNTANLQNNVLIENDTVTLNRSDQAEEVIADFSNNNIGFSAQTLIIDDGTQAAVVTESTNRIGRLISGSIENYFFRKNWSYPGETKNWEGTYDELVIKVKTTDQIHSPVYMYVVNGSNLSSTSGKIFGDIETGDISGTKKPTASWTLLAQDEYMSDFEEKVFDISNLGLNDVSQITIYTADEDLVLDIDDISVRRTNLLANSGAIRFRYSTDAEVIFHSIFYDAVTPEDTSLSIRIHASSSEDGLLRSAYSSLLNSGDIVALTGSYSEIEVVMNSNSDQTLSPILNSLELRILVDADFTGFVIDTETEWDKGILSKISTNDSTEVGKSYLTVSTPINVGGRYFSKSGSISEINDNNIGIYGFSGSLMPVSPNQAREWSSLSSRGFSTVTSVTRKFNNNFLIADLNNNRIVEVDNNGNLIKGFGSTYSIDTDFYPLSAVYNSNDKILTIVFTKPVVVANLSKIYFYLGSSKIYLSTSDTVLNNNKANNKILEIQLDDNTAIRLVSVTSSNLCVNFDAGAFTETINVPTGMTVSNNAIYSALSGLVCFVGNFTYIDNISHPVFVYETSDNNWVIGNSSIFYVDIDVNKEATRNVPDIIEIDPSDVSNTDNKLISSVIKFSDYSLGGIYESDGRFIITGLTDANTSLSSITGDDLRSEYDPVPESIEFRASAMDDLKEYAGTVIIIDKTNNRTQVLYTSPDNLFASSIDRNDSGDLVISESSFSDSSGRIITLNSYGNITSNYGSGSFGVINSVNALNNNKLIISV
jgi:hypothetical protein